MEDIILSEISQIQKGKCSHPVFMRFLEHPEEWRLGLGVGREVCPCLTCLTGKVGAGDERVLKMDDAVAIQYR